MKDDKIEQARNKGWEPVKSFAATLAYQRPPASASAPGTDTVKRA